MATETKTELIPLADRIVVTALKQDEVTASGLVIPDTAKEKPQQGEVLAVGPGKMDDGGNRITIDLEPGDRILYAKYSGTEIKLDGIDYIVLNEKDIRDLARNDPWRSLWLMRESCDLKLFANQDRELSIDQKNLLVWSRMYDNIQESMDCPTDDVIDDDDMLDGWFLLQAEKRKKEQAEMEFEEGTNEKIKNADEVFVVTNNEIDKERVEGLNNIHAHMVKQEREALLMRKHKSESDVFEFF